MVSYSLYFMKNHFPKQEEEILKFWRSHHIFTKSLKQRQGAELFSFYDGPPFATGLPHYGHLVASLIKDVVPRYQTMRGKYVERRWGWDCHGLPIENIVEEELGLKSKKDIEKIGIEKFNEKCREKVLTYRKEWRHTIERFGRWADMDNDYLTMDLNYMESIWWVFKQLWDKGLVYQDFKSMHICPRCETTLAQAEVSEGYKIIKDLSVVVKFELESEPGTFVLAWTTTPWTLPGNAALAVGGNIDYVKVKLRLPKEGASRADSLYIVAKERLEILGESFEILQTLKGKKLEGKKYKPLFDYFEKADLENKENIYTIQLADFVSTQEGTGVVHIAPSFGEDDMRLAKERHLPFIQHVNMDGTFKKEMAGFVGLEAKPKSNTQGTDEKIAEYLSQKNLIFLKGKYEHSYPHCWRCENPLLNYATTSWFVAVTKIKPKMLKLAKDIAWMPAHIKEGRFGNWLEGARDWAISRQRFWGSVIPIWECECGERMVFGSVAELERASGVKVIDLHKHIIDKVTFPCKKCHGEMKRIPDVLDTWFDSGSMPYAQEHYPFENKKKFEKVFPAKFIAEGVDQTIKWFYYLHVLSTAIKSSKAFRNVAVNGIVLASDGRKMSKRLKNYPAPDEILEKYGADATRYYFITSAVMKAEDLRFSEKEIMDVYRNVVVLLNNILEFYVTYAATPITQALSLEGQGGEKENVLDQWILARLDECINEVTENMEIYDLARAARPCEKFINDLSTWYLRRSRERFKEGDTEGIQVFGKVLLKLSKVIAPFMPFLAEHVYKKLTAHGSQLITDAQESVHLEDWPRKQESKKTRKQENILENMELTRKIVELALAVRSEAKIKVRQPLNQLKIIGCKLSEDYLRLMREELNIKSAVCQAGKDLKVELDTKLTPELELEGETREFIRQINQLRKEKNITVKDRVQVYYCGDIEDMVEKFKEEILKATLSESIKKLSEKNLAQNTHINKKKIYLAIERVEKFL